MNINKSANSKSRLLLILTSLSTILTLNLSSNPAQAYSLPPVKEGEVSEKIDYKNMQWALAALNASKITDPTLNGSSTVVAVVDTGVDYSIENLDGNLLPGYSTVYSRAIGQDKQNYDEVGHGSHVSSIIAGRGVNNQPIGLAPGAKILPVQVLSGRGGTDQEVADGIEYAIKANVSVINLSLGGEVNPFSQATPITCDAILKAYQANIPVVVAAGNSGSRGNPLNQPASCPTAISVAAIDRTLNSATFSSFDKSVFISAPGVDIVANLPNIDSQPQIASWSGTSMATPFISASIALYKQLHPQASVDEIKTALINSSTDIGTPGFDAYTGNGLLNLSKFLGFNPDSVSKIKSDLKRYLSPVVESLTFKKDQLNITFTKDSSILSQETTLILDYRDGRQSKFLLSNRPGSKIVNNVSTPENISSVFLKIKDKNSILYYSLPYTDIVDLNPVISKPILPDIKSFTASYKNEDLVLTYKMSEYKNKELSLWIFNDDIGFFEERKFKADLKGSTTIKLEDKRLLEHALSLTLTSVNSINYLLSPKYLIAVNKEKVDGSSFITIKAGFLCIFHPDACKSVKAKLIKGSKVIGSAPIDSIGNGVIEVKGDPQSIFVQIGKYKSRVLI